MSISHFIEIKPQNERLYTLKILSNQIDDLQVEISGLDKKNKQQLQNTPIVLEIKNNNLQANELAILIEILAQNNISVAAMRCDKQELIDFAKFLGLSILNNPSVETSANDCHNQDSKQTNYQAPKIVKKVVKSDMQVLSKKFDLVLLNTVNTDAEVMSGGSVFAYQEVQGKVFAGVYGNKYATIFIQSFDVQIISIAGIYKKFESVPDKLYKRCVMIDLHNGKLRFQIL